ncbi:MAG: hypothetical protein HOP29_08515 [Phycisphaerales bacterium]|nr:hypothetical protein [Phycisphaerales bacterium]
MPVDGLATVQATVAVATCSEQVAVADTASAAADLAGHPTDGLDLAPSILAPHVDAVTHPAGEELTDGHLGDASHDKAAIIDTLARLVQDVGLHIGHNVTILVDGHVVHLHHLTDGGVPGQHDIAAPDSITADLHEHKHDHGHENKAADGKGEHDGTDLGEHDDDHGIDEAHGHGGLHSIDLTKDELWHRLLAADLRNRVSHGAGKAQHELPNNLARREHDGHGQTAGQGEAPATDRPKP